MSRLPLRQFFFVTHLWLGLASGIVVTVLCLTGFLLALHPPIEQWLNRDLLVRQSQGSQLDPSTLVTKVTSESSKRFTALEIPVGEDEAWRFREGRETSYVDPFTGENLGQLRPLIKGFYRTVFRLHRWLLLDDSVGRPITGASTVIFLIVTMSGLVLWFDKCRKNYTRGLTLRRGVGWKRFNYDLHLVVGIYTLVPVVIMGVSGLFWSYNSAFKTVSYRVLDGTPAPSAPARDRGPKGEEPELLTSLPYESVLATVNQEFGYPGSVSLRFPEQGQTTFTVSKTREAGFWQVPSRDELEFDLEGKVVDRKLYADKTRAEKFLSVIKPIHLGTVWGNFSLVIYLVACLFATALPATGTVMWWNRIRAQRRSEKLLQARKDRETARPAD